MVADVELERKRPRGLVSVAGINSNRCGMRRTGMKEDVLATYRTAAELRSDIPIGKISRKVEGAQVEAKPSTLALAKRDRRMARRNKFCAKDIATICPKSIYAQT